MLTNKALILLFPQQHCSASTNRYFFSSCSLLNCASLQEDAANKIAEVMWIKSKTKTIIHFNLEWVCQTVTAPMPAQLRPQHEEANSKKEAGTGARRNTWLTGYHLNYRACFHSSTTNWISSHTLSSPVLLGRSTTAATWWGLKRRSKQGRAKQQILTQ